MDEKFTSIDEMFRAGLEPPDVPLDRIRFVPNPCHWKKGCIRSRCPDMSEIYFWDEAEKEMAEKSLKDNGFPPCVILGFMAQSLSEFSGTSPEDAVRLRAFFDETIQMIKEHTAYLKSLLGAPVTLQ